MNKIIYKGHEYEILIVDGNIVLQSLEHDIEFEKGYSNVFHDLQEGWWENGGIGKQSDYVSRYETESILLYINENKGQIIEHFNN